MLIKDLIKLLEEEYKLQESFRYHNGQDIMGEPEIVIDVFDLKDYQIEYRGFTPEIYITSSNDGVYRILTGWSLTEEEKLKSREIYNTIFKENNNAPN